MSDEAQREQESTHVVKAAWAFYLLLAVGGVVWVGSREGAIPLALFVDTGSWWIDVAAGLGCGGLLLAAWNLGLRRLGAAHDLEDRLAELLGPLTVDQALVLAFFSGVAEELFFRGAVQGSWGWLWATLLFALLHTGPGLSLGLWSAFAAVAGGLFGALMLWRGNLLAPMLAHFSINAVNLYRLGRAARAATESAAAGADDAPS
jgi:membrane protease YdiL (CAAX protease family)